MNNEIKEKMEQVINKMKNYPDIVKMHEKSNYKYTRDEIVKAPMARMMKFIDTIKDNKMTIKNVDQAFYEKLHEGVEYRSSTTSYLTGLIISSLATRSIKKAKDISKKENYHDFISKCINDKDNPDSASSILDHLMEIDNPEARKMLQEIQQINISMNDSVGKFEAFLLSGVRHYAPQTGVKLNFVNKTFNYYFDLINKMHADEIDSKTFDNKWMNFVENISVIGNILDISFAGFIEGYGQNMRKDNTIIFLL